jgi:hypothetical protein
MNDHDDPVKLMTHALQKGIWVDSDGIQRFGTCAIPNERDLIRTFRLIQTAAAKEAEVKWILCCAGSPHLMITDPGDHISQAEWLLENIDPEQSEFDKTMNSRSKSPTPGYCLQITTRIPDTENEVKVINHGFSSDCNGSLRALKEFERLKSIESVLRVELHIAWYQYLPNFHDWYQPMKEWERPKE